jgi:hypothetical protein
MGKAFICRVCGNKRRRDERVSPDVDVCKPCGNKILSQISPKKLVKLLNSDTKDGDD